MKHLFSAIGALALGAGAMYYFDPQQGRRRRALLQDKLEHISHDARDYAQTQLKHSGDRASGVMAAARSFTSADAQFDDGQLGERIRSMMGRKLSYPRAIQTEVSQGRVILRGHILAGEQGRLIAAIWALPSVKAVESQLHIHDSPGNEPSLQGEPHRIEEEASAMAAVVSAVAVAGSLLLGLKLVKAAAGMPFILGLLAAGGAGVKRLSHQEASEQSGFIERRETPRTKSIAVGDDAVIDRGSSVLH